jgi:hypothetical protein
MDNWLIFQYRYIERCGEGVVKVPRTDERAFKGVGISYTGKSVFDAETRKYIKASAAVSERKQTSEKIR